MCMLVGLASRGLLRPAEAQTAVCFHIRSLNFLHALSEGMEYREKERKCRKKTASSGRPQG